MNQLLIDILRTVAFDIDFSDIDWMLTDAEMTDQLTYGRDNNEPLDESLN